MSVISRLPTRPIGHHYVTNNFCSNDWSLFQSFDGRYIIPPHILPKDISFKTGIDHSWHQMFVRHLPFLNPAYSHRMNMGLNVDAQEDDEDWKSTSITWIKTFFGTQFQTYIYDCYVKYIIQQIRDTVKFPNFDPNTIENLQDVLHFIQGPLMLDLFRHDRNKCFNLLFMLYRRIGQSDNQCVTEEAIISYFRSNGIENIMLGEITFDKTQGQRKLRKHSLVSLAIAVNNRLLAAFKECEKKAFGCHLIMDRKVTIENNLYMGEGKYEIVTIDRTLAPRERYDRTASGALYYLKYDGKTTEGRLTTTSFFGITNGDIHQIIPKLVLAAVNAGITLGELIDMVSHEFTNGKCLIKFYSFTL